MSIFEYDEEKHLKNEREYAYREGKIEGIRILIKAYLKEGISKEKTLQMLEEAYSLSKEEAEAYYMETESHIMQA